MGRADKDAQTPQARILVVDDDDAFRRGIVKALTRAGYEVEEATDGREAIEKYRARIADIVLIDIFMPGVDGVEAMIRLRAEYPDVRIIVVSGGGLQADADTVLDAATRLGARGTMEKPVNSQTLLRVITEVLGRVEDSD